MRSALPWAKPGLSALAICATLAGCAPSIVPLRPYPAPDDVCRVVSETDATRQFFEDGSLLIGCPAEELGAIGDREAAGAIAVGEVEGWVLLSVPSGDDLS